MVSLGQLNPGVQQKDTAKLVLNCYLPQFSNNSKIHFSLHLLMIERNMNEHVNTYSYWEQSELERLVGKLFQSLHQSPWQQLWQYGFHFWFQWNAHPL